MSCEAEATDANKIAANGCVKTDSAMNRALGLTVENQIHRVVTSVLQVALRGTSSYGRLSGHWFIRYPMKRLGSASNGTGWST